MYKRQFLGGNGAIDVGRRRQLLQSAVSRRPGDLGLLMTLAGTYSKQMEEADERVRWYQAAVAAAPDNIAARTNLGASLCDAKRDYDGAIACFRKAVELDPKYAPAHSNLGFALSHKGRADEAIACYRKAIALDPKDAAPHTNLGAALANKGQLDEAIACWRQAVRLDPKYALARANLAKAEPLAARMALAWDRLPALRNGSYTPADNEERLALAEWCRIKKLPHTAAGLYAAAFAADPKLADDLGAGNRYDAACLAALAAAGRGEDAATLDDQARTRLRKHALDWLRADLALWTKQLETDRATVQGRMRHWQQGSDLAGIRDAAALAKLPADAQ